MDTALRRSRQSEKASEYLASDRASKDGFHVTVVDGLNHFRIGYCSVFSQAG